MCIVIRYKTISEFTCNLPRRRSAKPEPELLNDVLGNIFLPHLTVNRRLSGPQIDVLGRRCGNLLDKTDNPPDCVKREEDGNAHILSDKVARVPLSTTESLPPVE